MKQIFDLQKEFKGTDKGMGNPGFSKPVRISFQAVYHLV